jgi:DNA-binding response OmpR family regulator
MIVEDHLLIVEFVEADLRREGFDMLVAETCAEALQLLQGHQPALILLDSVLDDGSGEDLCRAIRSGGEDGALVHHADVPIIFLSARADEQDRLAGFRAGADDYIVKPFSPQELALRIRAILRRSQGASNAAIDIGPLRIDPRQRQVVAGDQLVDLTPKEFDLLHLLASCPGRVFSREYLLQRVWDYPKTVDTRTVDVHINRLRQKLGVYQPCGEMIGTKWGVGYQLAPLAVAHRAVA